LRSGVIEEPGVVTVVVLPSPAVVRGRETRALRGVGAFDARAACCFSQVSHVFWLWNWSAAYPRQPPFAQSEAVIGRRAGLTVWASPAAAGVG